MIEVLLNETHVFLLNEIHAFFFFLISDSQYFVNTESCRYFLNPRREDTSYLSCTEVYVEQEWQFYLKTKKQKDNF